MAPPPTELASLDTHPIVGKELRRRREFLVASGGARMRFSRKRGLLFVDRAHDVHVEDCLRFEDRRDLGTLDGFVADPDERPRLFSPAYLKPVCFVESTAVTKLELAGRLGRRPDGLPCRIVFEGRTDESRLAVRIAVRNTRPDHRLRLRLLGCRNPAVVASEGSPPAEVCQRKSRFHTAVTILRACGKLRVGDLCVPCPDAQVETWVHHHLWLGAASWSEPSRV